MAQLVKHAILDLGVVSSSPTLGIEVSKKIFLIKKNRGAWVAQSVKRLTSGEVMILGSWNQAPSQGPRSVGSMLSLSPCLCPSLACALCISLSNR